jgi:hypothetical protein
LRDEPKRHQGGASARYRHLEIIADWKVDLGVRIKRAQLRHELIGLSPEEIIALADEERDFKRLCQVLKAVIGHA